MILLSESQRQTLLRRAKQRKQRQVKRLKPSIGNEKAYERQLVRLINRFNSDVRSSVKELLEQRTDSLVNDSINNANIESLMYTLRDYFNNLNIEIQNIADNFTSRMNDKTKQQFYRSVRSAIGVDVEQVIISENLTETLTLATQNNVNLIKSIASDQLDKVEKIVYDSVLKKSSNKSMMQQIIDAGDVSKNRARFIARDQTAKLNANLTQARSENLGSKSYIWRVTNDHRLRKSHKDKNGKIFKWNSPPADTGHPGHDFNCRCYAEPIIDIDELLS